MKVCKNCRNRIPDGMKICPHCGKLPPRMASFLLYLILTVIAIVSAVYFRPFSNEEMLKEASVGMLWVAFAAFSVFALIFGLVSLTVLKAYRCLSEEQKLSRLEYMHLKNVRRHISTGRHYYDADGYCSFCGRKKKK